MRYTNQANILISSLKGFDKDDFEKWFLENNKYIVYNDFLGYLQLQKQLGVLEFAKELAGIEIRDDIVISDNIKDLIDQSRVNVDMLKKFYIKTNLVAGDNSVLMYLEKDKLEHNKKQQQKIDKAINFIIDNLEKLQELV